MKKVLLLILISITLHHSNIFGQSGFNRGIRSNQNGNASCATGNVSNWNDIDCLFLNQQ